MSFRRLRECVLKEIGEPISHGTLVELCVPRNKRSRSSLRYKSAANIVSKRACKGFDIKVNRDEKWSKSLDALQKKDHTRQCISTAMMQKDFALTLWLRVGNSLP